VTKVMRPMTEEEMLAADGIEVSGCGREAGF
jgi:hypothetical protein